MPFTKFKYKLKRPIPFFVAVTLAFGLLFIALIPPFQIPDEFTHFVRAYEVSELRLPRRHPHEKFDIKGSYMPSSIEATQLETKLRQRPHTIDVPQAYKYSWRQTRVALHMPLNKNAQAFTDTSDSPAYFPPLYVPQALVIRILAMFNAPVLLMMYATRLLGLLIWLVFGVAALRILDRFKYRLALASILLLPMFIAQASVSTDPLLNGITLLFLAIVGRLAINKQTLNANLVAIFALLLTLMVLAKPVYLVFGLLLLALPMRGKSMRELAKRLACLTIPLVLFVVWWVLTTDHGARPIYVESIVHSNASPHEQVKYFIPHVNKFIKPIINSTLLGWSDYIYTSLMGSFGKLDAPLPLIFVVMGYVMVFTTAVGRPDGEGDHEPLHVIPRLKAVGATLFLISIAYIAGVYLAMYLYSTPPGAQIVTGVQGRYFLSLLPMLVIFTPKVGFVMKGRAYNAIQFGTPLILATVSIVVIILRFYFLYP